ncbi:MAG: sigma 54-interacting transcriptional regulator [Clostridiales bacterium]
MTKQIVMVTEGSATADFYNNLLLDLFGSTLRLWNFSTEEGVPESLPDGDLYLIGATSSNIFSHVISLIPSSKSIVLITLTFQKSQLEPLRQIPQGTRALLVNLSTNMAIETIAELNRLGITHINMIPAAPNMQELPSAQLAITPGERRYVPEGISEILDIGSRVFTCETLTEIALKLGYNWFLRSKKYHAYLETLVESGQSVAMLRLESLRMENYLDMLMSALDMGVLGVNMTGEVFAANAMAQTIIGMSREVIGRELKEAAPGIDEVMAGEGKDKRASKLIMINGSPITLSTVPVFWQGDPVGCFVLLQRFTDEEKRQHQFRLQLCHRGYTSKYTFDDIVGESPAIVRAKNVARKMAQTDSSILLTGESGTGKELFAHSIHWASARRDMSFVAINCAALPESLLESELFGYAQGAFTGAKKGGKLGLFEYAHKGTLFLDEIEGMSQTLQLKLLRVLQEKEMMRVGDDRIISIDVRIIAASNEDILNMVHRGAFRRDLYYRLNTLPINIPPLREREDDLFLIMEAVQRKLGAGFRLSPQAREIFRSYCWDGNVRELINIVEYLRFADKELIGVEDLPQIMLVKNTASPPAALSGSAWAAIPATAPESLFRQPGQTGDVLAALRQVANGKEEAYTFVLQALLAASAGLGRGALCQAAREQGIYLTEQETRGILIHLNELGLVSVSRGRGGSRLTKNGTAIAARL